jgi:hypothetical protein
MSLNARATIGCVYQEPNRIAICPAPGSWRQKRHWRGRSRSSSL